MQRAKNVHCLVRRHRAKNLNDNLFIEIAAQSNEQANIFFQKT